MGKSLICLTVLAVLIANFQGMNCQEKKGMHQPCSDTSKWLDPEDYDRMACLSDWMGYRGKDVKG